jgi:hypothetical protein
VSVGKAGSQSECSGSNPMPKRTGTALQDGRNRLVWHMLWSTMPTTPGTDTDYQGGSLRCPYTAYARHNVRACGATPAAIHDQSLCRRGQQRILRAVHAAAKRPGGVAWLSGTESYYSFDYRRAIPLRVPRRRRQATECPREAMGNAWLETGTVTANEKHLAIAFLVSPHPPYTKDGSHDSDVPTRTATRLH